MYNYNNTEYASSGSVVCYERVVKTELGFCLVYKLVKRKRNEPDMALADVYDVIIKREGAKSADPSHIYAELTAVSSELFRAKELFDVFVKNSVTPMCAREIAEEYLFCSHE